ncbi:MAG TPA: penicillin acylase family protein [Anaerolineales bacterium]|nr:penicillin acylase family protein [Anaerolineales bacterium]
MSKAVKRLVISLSVLAVIVLILAGVLFWFTRQDFPDTDGSVQVSGLIQPVEIVRDEYGVAHIYAHTPEDLFFAEGYVHAQERFWQMEFQRRTAAGRLSEIFGQATLGTDKYLRQFGFSDLTRQSYDMLSDEARRVVDAYTSGVNAYISDRKPAQLGLEYALLGLQGVQVEIEPWTPVDSMIWAEMMIFDQSGRGNINELDNIDLLAAVGEGGYADLNPPYRQDRPAIIPTEDLGKTAGINTDLPVKLDAAEVNYLLALRAGLANSSPVLAELGFGALGGSNSFAVSGSKTTTGKPLFANDPHMSVNAPALWYEIGMHCVEKSPECIYNFRGFSLPGVPGILIGHNDRLAWGLTNADFDATDVFVERINPENPNQYEVNGEWVDMQIRREEIKVRGQAEPVVIFVRSTRNGLVASDAMIDNDQFSFAGDNLQLYALSYAWTALQPIRSVEAVLGVIRAQNWAEFSEALRLFDAGQQNWLYADVDGNIGYIMPGKVPLRAGGDGSLPVPGWNDDYIWKGFIPYEELPRTFNPAQGFIATANNPQVRPGDYPYLINTSQYRGQRAQRITELIQNDPDGISLEDMIAIQTDNQSLSALEIIPYLEDLRFDDPLVGLARDRLLTWDAQMTMDSPEAAIFNIFWVHLLAATFNDQLPASQYRSGGHQDADIVYFLLQQEDSPWWDDLATPETESRDEILERAFQSAYAEGVDKFGTDLGKWRWGELHTIYYRHATLGNSGIGLIENIFNRGPFPTNGSESVVQKTCWSAVSPYEVGCIPALRQVIDLGDLSNSRMIHSLGQSGHPMHPQYDHFIDAWRTFEYHPSNWLRSQVEAGRYDLLVLEPSP